ncbi:MAG: prolyl hydroxylase family protein [Rhizomicrobium sp.]
MDRAPDLERQAATGDIAAQIELGHRLAAEGQVQTARGWYARAAQGGSRDGLRELGASLLERPPFALQDGIRFIHDAAGQGDAAALRMCAALTAQDASLDRRWELALDFLARAAEHGSEQARTELRLLAHDTNASGDSAVEDWAALRDRVDIEGWLAERTVAAISEDPGVFVIENFASKPVCDWLIAESGGRLTRTKIYSREIGPNTVNDVRTSTEAGFDITRWGLPVSFLRARIARLTQASINSLENPMVLCYDPGQQYQPHFDFLDPTAPGRQHEIATAGQRVATFLVYLNETFEGGETEFVRLGFRVRGKTGDAVMWRNLNPDGSPDRRTLHAGRPPVSGRKWLLSQWVREDYPGAAQGRSP